MHSSSDILELALRNVGKLCSVHLDILQWQVQFEWAKICETNEEAEMTDDELQSAAVPGEPHGLRFDGITHYRSDNQDNLQVGYLAGASITGLSPLQHCLVRFDQLPLDLGSEVEFDFKEWSVLIAPPRHKSVA